jgi:hypothetical protein
MPNISASEISTDPTNPVWSISHGATRLEVSFARATASETAPDEAWHVKISLPALDITFDDIGATKATAFEKALTAFRLNGTKRGSPSLDLRAVHAELVRKKAFRTTT